MDTNEEHPLRRLRDSLNMSIDDLAAASGVSARTILRAEQGKTLYPGSRKLLCEYFKKTPEELGLLPSQSPQKSLLLSSKPGQTLSLIDDMHGARLTETLDQAELSINLAWDAWFASRPNAASRSVIMLLPEIEKIAYAPAAPGHTLRAKELAIRAHGLLGSVCLDALQNNTALYHYMQAHRFAEEIRDEDHAMTYLCLIGEVLRRQKNQSQALSHMERAREKASHISNTARGHILQLLEYTYGETGQEAAFERTISEATDLLVFSGEGKDISQKEFVPFEVYEIRGKINRDLGKPLNALPYLELAEESLATVDAATPRWYALLEISRAQAYCDAGDVTTGIELACAGLLKAYRSRSSYQMNRVRKLLRKLEGKLPRTHAKVQELKNLLYEIYIQVDNEALD